MSFFLSNETRSEKFIIWTVAHYADSEGRKILARVVRYLGGESAEQEFWRDFSCTA